MSNIKFEEITEDQQVKIPENLVFGQNFTTHYFEMDYETGKGWHNPTIKKFGNFQISPAALVFHYGQAIFEGLKAYKHADGKIALFRPDENIKRMNRSASRLCMPELDMDLAITALKDLVKLEHEWIPTKPGHSLYIRPLMFANDPYIGVKAGDKYKFMIMLSPVGPYYPEGFKPVPILTTDKYVRAVRKGVGDCKTAGNYAASLLAQREAKKEGYTQVLWLDAIEQKYIEEVGTMNIFMQFKDEVVTPNLTGSILPGVTRMSVIDILKDWGYNMIERQVSINEVVDAYNNQNLIEIFGTGTAAIISSVAKLKYNDTIMKFSDEHAGELGTKLYEEILGIQYGEREDKFGWMNYID
ncbi:MAG: branched-chain amino acid aminotransferase [Ignavibacteriales bacterium]|nr:branched-chain amino acid aminotransferase [Ignavibacteriales bacterium]MCB9259448.1 branched-chain amino acid aminotransferase [Ignavibacteriales bacterium]